MLGLDAWVDFALFRSASRRARELRALLHLHGPLPRRRLAALAAIEPLSEGATLGTAGARADAGARDAGVPRDLGRRLAEEVRARGHLPRPLRQRDRHAAASATTIRSRSTEFPDHLIKAVLATEDRRFYEHFGIDIAGTVARARHQRARRRRACRAAPRSPSSSPRTCSCPTSARIERKIKEAFLALWLEARLTKNEILKLYLDRAYMGGGAFGVDAAAQYLFQQVGARREPRRSRDARRPVQGADQVRAAHQPAGRARPRQRRARQPGRGRLHDRGPGVRRPPQSRHRPSTAATTARRTIISTGPSTR